MKKYYSTILIIGMFLQLSSQEIIELGFWEENGIFSLTSDQNVAFLGTGNIIDISNPQAPALLNSLSLPALGSSIKTDGDYLYFGTGMSVKLFIADVSDPANPFFTGSLTLFETGNGIFGMDVVDTVLFAAAGSDGVYAINISDKSNPSVIHSQQFGEQARDVVINDELIYVAESDRLSIIRVDVPDDWTYVAYNIGNYYSIDFHDELIFVGKGNGGFDTYSIDEEGITHFEFSTPASGGTAWNIKYDDNHIYLSANDGSLHIFQLNQNSATLKATYDANAGQAFGLALHDSLILMSGLIDGVSILQYDSLSVGYPNLPANKHKHITVYPNPAKNRIYLVGEALHNDLRIELWNLNGELLFVSGTSTLLPDFSIDVSQMRSGIYLLKSSGKFGTSYTKVIIQ